MVTIWKAIGTATQRPSKFTDTVALPKERMPVPPGITYGVSADVSDQPQPSGRKADMGSEWISVEDRLPEIETYYQTFNGSEIPAVTTEYYYIEKGWSAKRNVTHWQPLPEPPSES